ncbi:hypothetical protein ACHAWF_014219 [Thalassiosira exigua]
MDEVTLMIRVPGDESSTVDFAPLGFRYDPDSGLAKTLIPDNSAVASCWAPGAQILVTSTTILPEDAVVAEVESVDNTTGALTLVDGIPRPLSVADDPMAPVEIALLDRNIRFVAEDDDVDHPIVDGHGHGGHLIVFHTPNVAQLLQGVEMRGMGQQGNLGRYPIHFHMCDSVNGSVVEKNVIRNSNQRCLVIHGTDDVQIRENVAFNTSGHCFMLEDGAEQGNEFHYNLGAGTRSVQTTIKDDESDDMPATFWLTNPNNTWIGNVAGGSSHSGFWFEVMALVRGPSRMKFPDMEPRYIPLKLFTNNTAHSNIKGLHTYPQTGYRPTEPAIFKNHKSYRNRGDGVFFHAGGKVGLDGAWLADNRIAVNVDEDHSDFVLNSKIVGVTGPYKRIIESYGNAAYSYPWRANCRDDAPVSGIGVDSFYQGGTKAVGFRAEGVTFAGFGPSSCPGSHAFFANSAGYKEFFDPRTTTKEITFEDDSTKFDLCDSGSKYFDDIAIHDTDGSLIGAPGFIISNLSSLTSLSQCSEHPEVCAASCAGLCLRTMKIMIPVHTSPDMQLEISGSLNNGEALPVQRISSRHHKSISLNMREWSHRVYYLTLPSAGQYAAKFVQGGNEALWPGYADAAFEDKPGECGPDYTLAFEVPDATTSCEQLIYIGNAGDDIAGGDTSGWYVMMNDEVSIAQGGADGTAYSFFIASLGHWCGIGQYIDTRCVTTQSSYMLTAKIKLTKDGAPFVCNLAAWSSEPDSCPKASIKASNGSVSEHDGLGTMVESDKEWNTMTGVFHPNDFQANAGTVLVYFTGVAAGIDMQIDEVSLVPITLAPSNAPHSPPTSNPTLAPTTSSPTSKPTDIPTGASGVPDFYPGNALFSPDGLVTFNNDVVTFSAQSHGSEAVLLSSKPHGGIGDDSALEIKVTYTDRLFFGSGYQAGLALFFAPQDAVVPDLNYNDNMYAAFENFVVSTVRDRQYPTIDHTWVAMHTRLPDRSGVAYQSGGDGYQMLAGGVIKLRR